MLKLFERIELWLWKHHMHPLTFQGFRYGIMAGSWGDTGKAEEGITGTGDKVYEAGEMTPEERAQYEASFGMGTQLQSLLSRLVGMSPTDQFFEEGGELAQLIHAAALSEAGMSPEDLYAYETGGLGRTLFEQVQTETEDPFAFYESTLDPQLQLAEDYINQKWAGRGFKPYGTGMNLEEMGRAGVDLAIKEADARMRHRSDALGRSFALGEQIASGRTGALGRAAGLTEYIGNVGQRNVAALGNLYAQQQQFGLTALGRQAGQAQAAGSYWAYPHQAKLGDIYGRRAAMYAFPGQALGAYGAYQGAQAAAAGQTA